MVCRWFSSRSSGVTWWSPCRIAPDRSAGGSLCRSPRSSRQSPPSRRSLPISMRWKQPSPRTPPEPADAPSDIRPGCQVARLQRAAFLFANAEAVPEIALQSPIVRLHGLDACSEERGVDRSDRITDILGQVRAGSWIAPIEAVRQQIILRDHIVRNDERMQDQCAGNAGAVLARRTMDHVRHTNNKKKKEQTTKALGAEADIVAIGLPHDLQRVLGREAPAGQTGT